MEGTLDGMDEKVYPVKLTESFKQTIEFWTSRWESLFGKIDVWRPIPQGLLFVYQKDHNFYFIFDSQVHASTDEAFEFYWDYQTYTGHITIMSAIGLDNMHVAPTLRDHQLKPNEAPSFESFKRNKRLVWKAEIK